MADENGQHDPHSGHRHLGHDNDQGIKGALRYLRWLPQMWRSEINDAVVDLLDLQPGERGVDIGAGLGAGAMRAASTGGHVIAVEPTPFVRRTLVMRCMVSRRRRNIDVVEGSAERIPVGDQSVDAVWAVNTMHHWVDVDRAVKEIARVLRSGGRAVLVDEDFTDPAHPDHDRFGTGHGDAGHDDGDHGDAGHDHHGFTMVDAETVGGLLRVAGFTDVDTSTRQIAGRPVISLTARAGAAPPV